LADDKSIAILPVSGANDESDDADAEVERIESALNDLLAAAKRHLKYAEHAGAE